jgi:hypothetical protein
MEHEKDRKIFAGIRESGDTRVDEAGQRVIYT